MTEADTAGGVNWAVVEARLGAAKNYWLCTVRPDGRPHAVPVWGLWVGGEMFFGGGGQKARNLARNPHVAVHLESGEDAIVLEGCARGPLPPPMELVAELAAQSRAKYGFWPEGEPEPAYALRPDVVRSHASRSQAKTQLTWRAGRGGL